jgi:hypothetical protein
MKEFSCHQAKGPQERNTIPTKVKCPNPHSEYYTVKPLPQETLGEVTNELKVGLWVNPYFNRRETLKPIGMPQQMASHKFTLARGPWTRSLSTQQAGAGSTLTSQSQQTKERGRNPYELFTQQGRNLKSLHTTKRLRVPHLAHCSHTDRLHSSSPQGDPLPHITPPLQQKMGAAPSSHSKQQSREKRPVLEVHPQ